MKNEYKVIGDIVKIVVPCPTIDQDLICRVSLSKLPKLLAVPILWKAYKGKGGLIYVTGRLLGEYKGKTLIMHRFLTDAPTGMKVDHDNHNTLDNTDDNLKVVTNAQNSRNRQKPNSSGYMNVTKTRYNTWEVKVMGIKGKHRACFKELIDAVMDASTYRKICDGIVNPPRTSIKDETRS